METGLYDQDHMGYIPAGVIKEKFMGLQIPDSLAHAVRAVLFVGTGEE